MRRFLTPALFPALCLGTLLGCDDSDNDVAFAVHAPRADVIGFWQGSGEIAGTLTAAPEGFRFPVALVLRANRTFTLVSAHFPVAGQGPSEARQCDGVFAVQRGVISLFPDRLCRPLPLVRFSVRPGGANRLVLESVGQEFGPPGEGIRARYFLERAEGPLGVGLSD